MNFVLNRVVLLNEVCWQLRGCSGFVKMFKSFQEAIDWCASNNIDPILGENI